MPQNLIADIDGLDDNGNLIFKFDENPEATQEPKESPDDVLKKMAAGDPVKLANRYKAVQGWATKQKQENLELQRRLERLEKTQKERNSVSTSPKFVGLDPGDPDIENMFSNPKDFKDYLDKAIKSHLGPVAEYIQESLKPFQQVMHAYNTNLEVQNIQASDPNFDKWIPEMRQIAQSPEGSNMSIRELYFAAKAKYPEKALKLDGFPVEDEQDESTENQNDGVSLDNLESTSDVGADPSTQSNNAQSQQVNSDDLLIQAARTQTETGISGGDNTLDRTTNNSLMADIQAAFAEVTSAK